MFGALAVYTVWGLRISGGGGASGLVYFCSAHCLKSSWLGYGILRFFLLSSLQTPLKGVP